MKESGSRKHERNEKGLQPNNEKGRNAVVVGPNVRIE